jgi:cephalosporin hydroxylase
MLNSRLATKAKGLVPESTRKKIHDRLTDWAANRVLEEIIARTDNTRTVKWLGHTIWQHPSDAWLIQEVIAAEKPDLIVETGTFMGGSAYFFATLCDQLGGGSVISIDIDAQETVPHDRITYIAGSSVDPTIVDSVYERARGADCVFVVLDSDHSADHVLAELRAYSALIPVGGYLHVQDGLIDEYAVFGDTEPGPAAAVRRFLEEDHTFVRDEKLERRYLVTAHPFGWLKRVAPSTNGDRSFR